MPLEAQRLLDLTTPGAVAVSPAHPATRDEHDGGARPARLPDQGPGALRDLPRAIRRRDADAAVRVAVAASGRAMVRRPSGLGGEEGQLRDAEGVGRLERRSRGVAGAQPGWAEPAG